MKQTTTSPASPFTPERPKDVYSPSDRRRRRHHSTSSCSNSTSSSSLSFSPATTPSPTVTPVHHFLSTIPFSWENQPGVPKLPATTATPPAALLLPPPPPPPLRTSTGPRRRRSTATPDPFAAAMAECAKDEGGGEMEALLKTGRRAAALGGGRFGLVELYGSCKTGCSVAESTVRIPRASRAAGSYGLLLDRRAG